MPEIAENSETRSQQTGLSRVKDEVEVGYDSTFEDRWWKFEVFSWVVISVLLAAAVAGILGRGPLSRGTIESADHDFSVQYEKVVHFRTPAEMTFELRGAAIQNGSARVWISKSLFKQLQVQDVLPSPQQQLITNDGAVLVFATGGAQMLRVVFRLEPSSVGLYALSAKVRESEGVNFKVLSLP